MDNAEKKENEQDFVETTQEEQVDEKRVGSTLHSAAFGAGKFAPGTELRVATEKKLKRKLDARFSILVSCKGIREVLLTSL